MVTACPASRRPAGVSRTRRPSGSISGVPASRASAAICCDTVDGGDLHRLADLAHRAEAGQLEQQLETARVHELNHSLFMNSMSINNTWTRTIPSYLLAIMIKGATPARTGTLMAVGSMTCVQIGLALSVRCSASSARWARSGSGWAGPR
jgi:hypothetical protein